MLLLKAVFRTDSMLLKCRVVTLPGLCTVKNKYKKQQHCKIGTLFLCSVGSIPETF